MRAMGMGINLGNTLEAPIEGAWAPPAVEVIFDVYKRTGFRAVRIPVRWDNHTAQVEPYGVDPTFMSRIKQVVGWSLERGLITVVNVHHDDWLDDPVGFANKLPRMVAIWKQISTEFSTANSSLLFEVFNEPHLMTVEQLNSMNAAVLPVIRAQNPYRIVLFGGLQWMNPTWLTANPNSLVFPPNDPFVMVEIHNYDPYGYTKKNPSVLKWGTQEDKSDLQQWITATSFWASERNLSVFYGEFGCTHDQSPSTGRLDWYTAHRELGLAAGFAMAVWDDDGMFAILNRTSLEWGDPQVIVALGLNATAPSPGPPSSPCPGGTLQSCIDQCPSSPPTAFQQCVTACGKNCPQLERELN